MQSIDVTSIKLIKHVESKKNMNELSSFDDIGIIITDRNTDLLCELLQAHLPAVKIQQWPDISDPESIKLAVLWDHPPGITDNMSHLKMVVSMGAGMDHINTDVCMPSDIKQGRIVTQALKNNMAQYVLQHILSHHRYQRNYQKQQVLKRWQVLESDEKMPVVGLLGLGALGTFVADRCADLGYQTVAWTTQQNHPKHTCYHGIDGLQEMCRLSNYLVVLLPLNQDTQGIINTETLSWCGPDTVLINVGRGGHVVEDDLLLALKQGVIKHAILDVFNEEPLSSNHPFWEHEKITLTPHSSSRSDTIQTVEEIVKIYQQL